MSMDATNTIHGPGVGDFVGDEVVLHLPFPPSINTYWRRNGRTYFIDKKGRDFRKAVMAIAAERDVQTFSCDLKAELALYPPDRRTRDCDNYFKGVGDSLRHAGLYGDDSQIKVLVVSMFDKVDGGLSIVRLTPYIKGSR